MQGARVHYTELHYVPENFFMLNKFSLWSLLKYYLCFMWCWKWREARGERRLKKHQEDKYSGTWKTGSQGQWHYFSDGIDIKRKKNSESEDIKVVLLNCCFIASGCVDVNGLMNVLSYQNLGYIWCKGYIWSLGCCEMWKGCIVVWWERMCLL